MRRVTAILSMAAVVLTAAGLAAQANPSVVDQAKPRFAGEWKVQMPMGQGQGEPGVDLTVTQTSTTITFQYRASRQGPAPGKFTYRLDGSVNRNMVAGPGGSATAEQVSKAMWVGNNLVVTTTTGAGEEKRTFSTDGVYLVIEVWAPGPNGRAANVTKFSYQRYERGFGG
jgi:hypothetical protein